MASQLMLCHFPFTQQSVYITLQFKCRPNKYLVYKRYRRVYGLQAMVVWNLTRRVWSGQEKWTCELVDENETNVIVVKYMQQIS